MKKVALTLLLLLLVPAVYAGDGIVHKKPDGELIKDSYIVVFHAGESNPAERANELARTHGGKVNHVYRHALLGAHFLMTEGQARGMAHNPHVALVQQEGLAYVVGDQANPTWGIDRVDQRDLPLSNSYHWDYDGTGVTAFILDTGIRTTHNDFGGRASWGTDCTDEGQSDGHGHGTHVAGTVGSATYGVAKNVNLVAVKICTSGGWCPDADILCGIDYVTQQKQGSPSTPMVANMSIRGPYDATMNNAVNNSVAEGVFYAVAAGNDYGTACDWSPASAEDAYTTGATDSGDGQASFSNSGSCVDIHAPGVSILSTHNSSDTATATMSGTSMASPHVCGAGALVFDQYPTWTPFQVMAELTARATSGVISPIDSGSPNLLLYTLDDAVVAICGTTPIFDHAPGNTYDRAQAQVYLPPGMAIYSATLTGQGHNQDLVGYVRTMRVGVNGNTYTVLPWLPSGQTQSFDFNLPVEDLVAGANDFEAYIHFGNDYYDNGHWVTVNLAIDAQCAEASVYGTTMLFDHAPGNTYNKATIYVHVAEGSTLGTVRLTGQGHNQDLVGYARTMRVEVNGNTYTVISWLSQGQTKSFDYTLPSGVLTTGWNEIKAYIHWSNDYYDNGHWVSVDLVLESP